MSQFRSTSGEPVQALRAEIDLAALRHNIRVLRDRAGGTPLMAVVKADAYGHGVENTLPVFRSEGITAYGVASVAEGAKLRALGLEEQVLVFASPHAADLREYLEYDLDVTVSDEAVVDALLALGSSVRVHVKVDTGMHRLGLDPSGAARALNQLLHAPHVEVAAVWTHLATADEEDLSFAGEQIRRFETFLDGVGRDLPVHIANSGALSRIPEAVRERALVRPGGLLYGIPSSRALAESIETRPVMRLVSRVVHVQVVDRGESVSYGRTWSAPEPRRIATVAAGYADGIPRQLSNRATMSVRGMRFPVAGTVCMDMFMLDLGPPDGPGAAVECGDEVTLMGPGGPGALELARAAGTISYAIPCGLNQRVPRLIVNA